MVREIGETVARIDERTKNLDQLATKESLAETNRQVESLQKAQTWATRTSLTALVGVAGTFLWNKVQGL